MDDDEKPLALKGAVLPLPELYQQQSLLVLVREMLDANLNAHHAPWSGEADEGDFRVNTAAPLHAAKATQAVWESRTGLDVSEANHKADVPHPEGFRDFGHHLDGLTKQLLALPDVWVVRSQSSGVLPVTLRPGVTLSLHPAFAHSGSEASLGTAETSTEHTGASERSLVAHLSPEVRPAGQVYEHEARASASHNNDTHSGGIRETDQRDPAVSSHEPRSQTDTALGHIPSVSPSGGSSEAGTHRSDQSFIPPSGQGDALSPPTDGLPSVNSDISEQLSNDVGGPSGQTELNGSPEEATESLRAVGVHDENGVDDSTPNKSSSPDNSAPDSGRSLKVERGDTATDVGHLHPIANIGSSLGPATSRGVGESTSSNGLERHLIGHSNSQFPVYEAGLHPTGLQMAKPGLFPPAGLEHKDQAHRGADLSPAPAQTHESLSGHVAQNGSHSLPVHSLPVHSLPVHSLPVHSPQVPSLPIQVKSHPIWSTGAAPVSSEHAVSTNGNYGKGGPGVPPAVSAALLDGPLKVTPNSAGVQHTRQTPSTTPLSAESAQQTHLSQHDPAALANTLSCHHSTDHGDFANLHALQSVPIHH